MSGSVNTWGELLTMRAGRMFIGHRAELEQFRLNCVYDIPESLLFIVGGVPGVGKSAMLRELKGVAGEYGMMSAGVDRNVGTAYTQQVILNTLLAFSDQIRQTGAYLSTVEEQYRTYIEALETIAQDELAPARVFDAFSGLYDDDEWYVRSWQTYLETKFSRNVIALLRDPVGILTNAFVHDLNAWSMVRRVLLCFDDWQVISQDLEMWLVDLLQTGKLRTQIWIVLATSEPLSELWQPFASITAHFDLQPWSPEETETFLRLRDEEHPRRIKDVVSFAKGLPLWAELLSSATSGTAGDLALTPLDRYLKWLDDATRRAVLLCSAARVLDEAIVNTILGDDASPEYWTWLLESPLTQQQGKITSYHPSLRPLFVDAAWREYPERYRDLHHRLWEACTDKQGETFEGLYHGFAALIPEAIESAVESFCYLLRGEFYRVDALLDACLAATGEMDRENVATEWANQLREGWFLIQQQAWDESLVWLAHLLQRDDLTPKMETDLQALNKRISSRIPAPVEEPEPVVEQETTVGVAAEKSATEEIIAVDIEANASPDELAVLLEEAEAEAPRVTVEVAETAPLDIVELEPEPTPDVLAFERAMRALQEHNTGAALAAFDETIALNAGHVEAHFQRGELLAKEKRFDEAVIAYAQALVLQPNYTEAIKRRGMAFLKLRKYSPAVEDLTTVLVDDPHDIAAYYHRANANFSLERFSDAIADYDAVLSRNPMYVDAYINRGLARKRMDAYAAAIEDFTAALQVRAASVRVLLYRGDTYMRMQAYTSALADYDAAKVLNPENVQVHNNRGLVFVKMERYEDALAAYRDAIALDESYATAWFNAACAAGLSADADTAARMLARAIELNPAYREKAKTDTDFDAVRDAEVMQALLNGVNASA